MKLVLPSDSYLLDPGCCMYFRTSYMVESQAQYRIAEVEACIASIDPRSAPLFRSRVLCLTSDKVSLVCLSVHPVERASRVPNADFLAWSSSILLWHPAIKAHSRSASHWPMSPKIRGRFILCAHLVRDGTKVHTVSCQGSAGCDLARSRSARTACICTTVVFVPC